MERDWDVLITTYEICNLEKTALSRFAWQYLIIDEVGACNKVLSTLFGVAVALLAWAKGAVPLCPFIHSPID